MDGPSFIKWMTMPQEEFSARFKGSPIKRTKRRGLLRNVAVALGNWGAPEAVSALAIASNNEEPLVRGHAAWALGRIGTEVAMQALRGREEGEADAWVREEIAEALDPPGALDERGHRERSSAIAEALKINDAFRVRFQPGPR